MFTLLNEMDGLAEAADVVFLVTPNRAAIPSRPVGSDRSASHDQAGTRDSRTRSAVAAAAAPSRSTTSTLAPARPSATASSWPRPPPAPVTTASR